MGRLVRGHRGGAGSIHPAEVALWRAVIGASFLTVLLVAGGSGLPGWGAAASFASWR